MKYNNIHSARSQCNTGKRRRKRRTPLPSRFWSGSLCSTVAAHQCVNGKRHALAFALAKESTIAKLKGREDTTFGFWQLCRLDYGCLALVSASSKQRTHTHSQRNEDVLMVTNSVQRCLRCEVNGGAVLFICSAHGFIKINWMNTVRVCARHASNVYAVEKKRAILHIYGNNCIFVEVLILNDGCEICTIDNRKFEIRMDWIQNE